MKKVYIITYCRYNGPWQTTTMQGTSTLEAARKLKHYGLGIHIIDICPTN